MAMYSITVKKTVIIPDEQRLAAGSRYEDMISGYIYETKQCNVRADNINDVPAKSVKVFGADYTISNITLLSAD